MSCRWCDADGRDGCPVHVDRMSFTVSVALLSMALVFVLVLALIIVEMMGTTS